MDREVFLLIGDDEISLGTVQEVLNLAGIGAETLDYSDDQPLAREELRPVLIAAGTLAYLVGDMVCGADECDTNNTWAKLYSSRSPRGIRRWSDLTRSVRSTF